MIYPHLIETTLLGYERDTYVKGLCSEDELTPEEKEVLKQSEVYVKEYEAKRDREVLLQARRAFEQLRDIEGLPEEAVEILKQWTFRDGDDNEE